MGNTIMLIQFFFTIIIGLYFLNLLKSQQNNKISLEKDSQREMEKLERLKSISLTLPLSEKTRPNRIEDIIGQEKGLKALKAALCGPNPQHVIIYGPPGTGKTAAARVILKEAKNIKISPFTQYSKFVEMDATTLRFDERCIADPLIGSVHDPIYQGAGSYGHAGIPQPKPGAVTKAHGGILFIDEIGELHPIQMNKLLKVLEDRKVFLESAYYSPENPSIPLHIHEIFKEGLPADFRLVGATTRQPEDIPPALRSRCVEIFFNYLDERDISKIALSAAIKGGFNVEVGVEKLVSKYATNGRDAVNIIQIAGSIAQVEGRRKISIKDIEWVLEFSKYCPRIESKVSGEEQVGIVNGLAILGMNKGSILEIEANAVIAKEERGKVVVTGIIEEEEVDNRGQKLKRNSTARASVENMLTVLKKYFEINTDKYNIHINFPGGMPVDGPSAGVAIVIAVYSAIKNLPVSGIIAMTGEISIKGKVRPVGGVFQKIEAAKLAGVKKVLIPQDNNQELFKEMGIDVIPVSDIFEIVKIIFNEDNKSGFISASGTGSGNVLSASTI
jgi:Lon-like ATP-dependent protease